MNLNTISRVQLLFNDSMNCAYCLTPMATQMFLSCPPSLLSDKQVTDSEANVQQLIIHKSTSDENRMIIKLKCQR
jgi:hypothetical protein